MKTLQIENKGELE